MISELDTGYLERVELNYVSERTDSFHSAYFSPRTEQTVYDDRQEGFSDFMTDLGAKLESGYDGSLAIEVTPYQGGKHTIFGRSSAVFTETDGVRVSIIGPDLAIEELMGGIAKAGYGIPQDKSFMADWRHPVQSVKGYLSARGCIEALERDVVENERLEGSVRHITYEIQRDDVQIGS